MTTHRLDRLNALFQAELSDIIQKQMKDPRIGLVSVTAVEVTPDLRHAKVYISILGDEEEIKKTWAILEDTASFLRRELSHRLYLRRIPELTLHLDTSLARGDRILRLLRELSTQDKDG